MNTSNQIKDIINVEVDRNDNNNNNNNNNVIYIHNK